MTSNPLDLRLSVVELEPADHAVLFTVNPPLGGNDEGVEVQVSLIVRNGYATPEAASAAMARIDWLAVAKFCGGLLSHG